jgi:hypothetical protein
MTNLQCLTAVWIRKQIQALQEQQATKWTNDRAEEITRLRTSLKSEIEYK